jgi:hypothetical protein
MSSPRLGRSLTGNQHGCRVRQPSGEGTGEENSEYLFGPAACALAIFAVSASAQTALLPANTMIPVTPVQEITTIKMKEGDTYTLQTASDVTEKGVVVIPRGAPVNCTITWRTGKGIGGKSAKFDLTFNSVMVGVKPYALKGKHRQEGKGNTVAALLGSMVISGHSAVMASGQIVNAFTVDPIPVG